MKLFLILSIWLVLQYTQVNGQGWVDRNVNDADIQEVTKTALLRFRTYPHYNYINTVHRIISAKSALYHGTAYNITAIFSGKPGCINKPKTGNSKCYYIEWFFVVIINAIAESVGYPPEVRFTRCEFRILEEKPKFYKW
uniref:Cystatin domain-containing protein n=1 Tax=Panagrellus redivivus TaxID=6233 RepID=A0A7E4ZVI3_PANRE